MKKIVKHGPDILTIKEETFMVLEKLDGILQRLNVIEDDLRELKEIAHLKREREEEPTAEYFMEK
jgi:hypothetical protein